MFGFDLPDRSFQLGIIFGHRNSLQEAVRYRRDDSRWTTSQSNECVPDWNDH